MSDTPIERLESNAVLSQVVIHERTVYLAGQVAEDGTDTVADQTRTILRQIDERLAAAGSDRSRLLSATIYLRDIATFPEMNAVWKEWVDTENPPVRATVEAGLVLPELRVEISVIAAR